MEESAAIALANQVNRFARPTTQYQPIPEDRAHRRDRLGLENPAIELLSLPQLAGAMPLDCRSQRCLNNHNNSLAFRGLVS